MSRTRRKPINISASVEVKIDDNAVTAKKARGTLIQQFHPNMTIFQEGNELIATRPNDGGENRMLYSLTRMLVHNMVIGVIEGFKKELDIPGVNYRMQKQGRDLVVNLGHSHQMIVSETDKIQIEIPTPSEIIIHGIDKQKVGQFTAEVREKRPPEPCKGKGIRYAGEFTRCKEGKAGKGPKK